MLFVATGGTIDKLPVRLSDGSFNHASKKFGDTHLPAMLRDLDFFDEQFFDEHDILQLFMADSLDMNGGHRSLLSVALAGSKHNQVIVTHGTDTMIQTAKSLSGQELLAEKAVVLTGAMEPYSMGEASDALRNLRGAIRYAQILDPGVYISMHGDIFDVDNVRKDYDERLFKSLR